MVLAPSDEEIFVGVVKVGLEELSFVHTFVKQLQVFT